MRKLILGISVSIDGCMESSDANLNFAKTRSPEGAAWVAEKMGQAGAILIGRKAFCQMASFWPAAHGTAEHPMNQLPKIVFSKKGFDPAQASSAKRWADAKVITGDLAGEITALKRHTGKDLLAIGGIEFAQALVQTGLIDEFRLAIHPVAAGNGFRLFEKLCTSLPLTLIDSKVFSTGAMVLIYQREMSLNT